MSESRVIEIIVVLICMFIAWAVIRAAPFGDANIKWACMALAAVLAIVYLL